MKKIGIITFHFPQNVGAILQCVAMNEKLRELNIETFVINYRPKYHVKRYEAWQPVIYNTIQKYNTIKHQDVNLNYKQVLYIIVKQFIGGLWGNLHFLERKKRKRAFDSFIEANICQSILYNNISELKKNPPKADIYVCGSDQIWNKSLTNGQFDEAYFLRFGAPNITRIAFAPSMGETDIFENKAELLKLIDSFDLVLMRESSDSEKISKISGKVCKSVNDPTLLLTRKDYLKFLKPIKMKKPFIFVYTVLKSKKIEILLNNLRIKGLDIIDGSVHHYIHGNNVIYDALCAPGEFLSYIDKAEIVVTNSFHGTVFSLIFHKNFITVANNKRNSRMEDLLNYLGLQDRLIYDDVENIYVENLKPIDYEIVDQKLKESREHDIAELMSYIKED